MPSIVEALSKRLDRSDARIALAERADVAPAVARTAIEPAGRAVVAVLARGANQDGGAGPVADLVAAVGSLDDTQLVQRLRSNGALGSDLVDALFGDDLEAVAAAIGPKKSNDPETGSTLLAQLTPAVLACMAGRQDEDELDADGLAAVLAAEADEAGSEAQAPSVEVLASAATMVAAATVDDSDDGSDDEGADDAEATDDTGDDADGEPGPETDDDSADDERSQGTTVAAEADESDEANDDRAADEGADDRAADEGADSRAADEGADSRAADEGAESRAADEEIEPEAEANDGRAADDSRAADEEADTDSEAQVEGESAKDSGGEAEGGTEPDDPDRKAAAAPTMAAGAADRPTFEGDDDDETASKGDRSVVVIGDDGGRALRPVLAVAALVGLALAVAWLVTQVTSNDDEVAAEGTSTSAQAGAAESVAGPETDEGEPAPEGLTETETDSDPDEADESAETAADSDQADDRAGSDEEDAVDPAVDDTDDPAVDDTDDPAADGTDADADAEPTNDADLARRVAAAVQATGLGDDVAITAVGGEVTLGGEVADADASAVVETAVAEVGGVGSVINDIRLNDAGGDEAKEQDEGSEQPSSSIPTGSDSLNEQLGLDPIRFEYYSEDLSPAGQAELDRVVTFLDANEGVELEIQGHTDDVGDAALNRRLGQRRADAVRSHLIDRGVDPDRLTAIGIGEVEPVTGNDTESGREANRRIEFIIK